MTRPSANASIVDVTGGAQYRVRLDWIPRTGELIELWPFTDPPSSMPGAHTFEVVQIVHKLFHVVATDLPREEELDQTFMVYVKSHQPPSAPALDGLALPDALKP
jgi:hypothetical protein